MGDVTNGDVTNVLITVLTAITIGVILLIHFTDSLTIKVINRRRTRADSDSVLRKLVEQHPNEPTPKFCPKCGNPAPEEGFTQLAPEFSLTNDSPASSLSSNLKMKVRCFIDDSGLGCGRAWWW